MAERAHTKPSADLRRLVFAGSPQFAADILAMLLDEGEPCGWQVSAVLTQPDRAAKRGQRLQPSPTKELATRRGLPLYQPHSLRNIAPDELLLGEPPDLLVVAAYGLILPQAWLDWPRLGAINIHTSLLPRWRGAAPIERAIMAGDTSSGVCVMHMDASLDTGAILAQAECDIDEQDDALVLEQKLADRCGAPLLEVLRAAASGGALPAATPQAEAGVLYADKLTKQDAQINWQNDAAVIARQVRALTGRGGAQTRLADATRLSIFSAEATAEASASAGSEPVPAGIILAADKRAIRVGCGSGALNIQRARLARGKGSLLSAADLVNGFPDAFRAGVQLASPSPAEEL